MCICLLYILLHLFIFFGSALLLLPSLAFLLPDRFTRNLCSRQGRRGGGGWDQALSIMVKKKNTNGWRGGVGEWALPTEDHWLKRGTQQTGDRVRQFDMRFVNNQLRLSRDSQRFSCAAAFSERFVYIFLVSHAGTCAYLIFTASQTSTITMTYWYHP